MFGCSLLETSLASKKIIVPEVRVSGHRILPLEAENFLSLTSSLNETDLFDFDVREIVLLEFEFQESFSARAFKAGAETGIILLRDHSVWSSHIKTPL